MSSKTSEKYARTFETLTGADVLDDLKAQFYSLPALASESQHQTTVRAAQRDVVQYIIDMVEGRDE